MLARLEKEQLAPSPEADRATLIRRLSLDLIGLPPTPDEVDAFLMDNRPDAYERLVDRLLASPHYGERWGRHWLDLARYADSDGYEKDNARPYAWRYRNWVINALNANMPYEQFTVEQLAGDLLPNATLEQKVATGFHRNTLTNTEGGVDQEQFRVEAVVDRVDTTAKVWLGVTMGCARCHDHKYDPFSQREFYELFAFFNSDVEKNIPAPVPGEQEVYDTKKAKFDEKKAELVAAVEEYTKTKLGDAQQEWETMLTLPGLRKLPEDTIAVLLINPEKRTDEQKKQLAEQYAKVDRELIGLKKLVELHQRNEPNLTQSQTLALGDARQSHVMIRGDFLRPGIEVDAGTPGVLHSLSGSDSPRSGTRLDLAQWLVDPGNPLTARVTVNWVWQKYFGRGIVATLEDFGARGEPPSHPELLDWLALEFINPSNGAAGEPAWSLKRLHKLIATSATYRQSSYVRPELLERDPLNVLLARQSRFRLNAEVIRDNALEASGLLVKTIGGPSVRPPQPPGISELTYANSAKWVESKGPDRYRRGMYTWFQRTSPYPMLMTFDSPDAIVCCCRRERSNTPLQALTLLNDTVFVECAQALGKRVVSEVPDSTEARLRQVFRLCLSREPTGSERTRLTQLYNELLEACKAAPEESAELMGDEKYATPETAAWVALARAIMNLDEFVTRE